MAIKNSITHATRTSNLADVLERVLDKGVVIAGDIKIKLVDIELLTIQIRLVICSVERAMEMGMDWWRTDPNLSTIGSQQAAILEGERAKRTLAEPTLGLDLGQPEGELARAFASRPPAAVTTQEARMADLEQTVRRLEKQLACVAQG